MTRPTESDAEGIIQMLRGALDEQAHQMQRLTRMVQSLNAVAIRLNRARDPLAVVTAGVDALVGLVCPRIAFFSYLPEADEFRLAHAHGYAGATRGVRADPTAARVMADALGSGRPRLFDGCCAVGGTTVPGAAAARGLVVPMRGGGRAAGIVCLSKDGDEFADLDVNLAVIIVEQLGAALSNSLLLRRIELESITDGLTGLYIFRHFESTVDREIARRGREGYAFSLVMLDIDYFKRINDTYGHPSGNIVLRTIASIVRRQARITDTAFRYGGEEFALLLPRTDLAGAACLAERIRRRVEETEYVVEGATIRVTVSAGVAEHRAGSTREALVAVADERLMAAKTRGRNRVIPSEAVPDRCRNEPLPPMRDESPSHSVDAAADPFAVFALALDSSTSIPVVEPVVT